MGADLKKSVVKFILAGIASALAVLVLIPAIQLNKGVLLILLYGG